MLKKKVNEDEAKRNLESFSLYLEKQIKHFFFFFAIEFFCFLIGRNFRTAKITMF